MNKSKNEKRSRNGIGRKSNETRYFEPMLSHKIKNTVGMALIEATLSLYRKTNSKTSEHVIVIVRTSCHISIPCFITFSASAIPTPFLFF